MAETASKEALFGNTINCEKYSKKHAAYALIKFLENVDIIESKIGEYRNSGKDTKPDFIVTGLQLHNGQPPVDLLSTISTSIERNNSFLAVMGASPIQLLKMYGAEYYNGDEERIDKTISKFRSLLNNKYLIKPFKIDSECNCILKDNKAYTGKIVYINWGMDNKEKKFKGKVMIHVSSAGKMSGKYLFDFEDYGKKFSLTGIELSINDENVDKSIIQMTRFGIIKPIVISGGSISLILDGYGLYINVDNRVYQAGLWNNGKLEEYDVVKNIKKQKVYKYLKDNLDYISKHLRFIAPYNIVEANVILIK